MHEGNGQARVIDIRTLRITRRSTVAARLVVVEIEHGDERQGSLDFGEQLTTSGGRSDRRAPSQSGVHVIDCDALEITDGAA